MNLRLWPSAVAAGALALLLAACSSPSPSGQGRAAAGGAGGDDTAGVTDTEIHVGGIVGNRLFGDAAIGAKARIKQANDAGGVHGRKIVLDEIKDDGLSAATTTTAVRALVQQKKVLALVPVVTTFLPNSVQFLTQQNVPVFGFGIDDSYCSNDNTFAFNGCPSTDASKVLNIADYVGHLLPGKTVKGHTIAIVGDDGESPKQTMELYGAVLEKAGGEVVLKQHSIPAAGGSPVSDFTPYATEVLRSANGKAPDYVMVLTTALNSVGVSNALSSAGYQGLIQDFTLYDPKLVKTAKGNTELFSIPSFQNGTPGVDRMLSAIKATKPDQPLTQPLGFGYWSADLFVKALEKAGRDVTRSSLIAALNGGFEYVDQGGIGRVSYPAMHKESSGCMSTVASDGAKYNVVRPFTCAPTIPNPTKK